MAKAYGGVAELASRVSARRQGMSELDMDEINDLADSWRTSFDLFGIDPEDPVVGSTVLVTAKMLKHRVDSLTEFGQENLEPSLYVTGEAAMVGLNMVEKARRPGPSRFHRLIAFLAAVILILAALAAMKPPVKPAVGPVPTGLMPGSGVGTAWVRIDAPSPEQAVSLAQAYNAGQRRDIPVVVTFDAPDAAATEAKTAVRR